MQSLLRSVFELHAARPAVQGRSAAWTYAELDRTSAELAQDLLDRGAGPGQTVPILMGRSPLLVLTQLAVVRIGAAYSPIDMSSPPGRQRAMLDAIGSPLLLTDVPTHPQEREGVALFDVAAWLQARSAGDSAVSRDLWLEPPAECPVYVMFTSGSTGTPKGVMVPHAGIVRLVVDANYAHFGPEQRWGFLSSPAFDLSTLEVWGALLNGGCCVVQEEPIPSLDTLGEFLLAQHVTDTWLTSALFNAMVEDQLPSLGLLQQLLVGGERVSPQHARLMLQAHPAVRLINGYGPTENTTFTLCHTIALDDTEGAAGVPIGTPLSGTQVRVDPSEADQPDKGELWTAGAGVALGYLGDAELTQRKFVWHDGARWYRTGDLVRRRADGVFEFHGRIDRQIKLRGQRIELEEVELALTRCPGVGNAAVLVVGDSAEQRRIVAVYSLLDAGTGPGEPEVVAHMRQTLPEASVPSEFVRMAQLPANLNGKVDRKALEAMWAAGEVNARSATQPPVLGRLRHAMAVHGHRVALEDDAGLLSYAELDRRSALLASRLLALGAAPGDHVALFLPRSTLLVLGIVACVRIGAVYAPIDLASPPERIRRMLDVLQPRLALADAQLETAGLGEHAWFDPRAIDWTAAAPALPDPPAASERPICIFFTSGSTGLPKAVMVPARGIDRLVRDGRHAHFGPEQRWAFLSSPAFDAASLEIWGALLNGGTCVVQEEAEPSLETLGQFIVERRISDAWMTAGLFNAMVQEQLPVLGQLTQLLVGGERVSPQHARQMLKAHADTRLINGYGPTENTTFTLCHTIGLADTNAAAGVPIGTPIPGTRVRLEAGELWAAGDGVALGYHGDAELTQRKFVLHDGERWYRTGDLAHQREDGVFEFLGRADRQVKLQGHRVEIDEVEAALASFPGIGQSAIVVRGNDAAGRHLAACFCALSEGAPVEIEALAAHLAALLPPAAMPKEFRPLRSLPTNLNGKTDRDALVLALDAEDRVAPKTDATVAATMSAPEAALAAVWQELLPHARIDRDSHFLRIGGTSLLALHVSALAGKRLGRQLSPVDVLRHPVLADQARVAEQSDAALHSHQGTSHAEFPGWDVPLTRGQQNLLAASRLDASGCAYLVHVALQLPTLPDLARWQNAFAQLARRHPALRLLAHHDGSAARARLQDDLPDGWWQQHATLPAAPRDLHWPDALLAQVNRPLDTRTQGSMRVDAWPVQGGGALVVWTVHHHVIDESAVATALTELDALLQGRALPPVYGSPFAFAAVEAAWSDPRAIEAWATRMASALGAQTPPLEHAPAAGRESVFALDAPAQARLQASCAALGCTPFPLLLAAYGLAVQQVFGASFRFVSTPFSRRAEPELIEPVGYLLDVRFIEAGALPSEEPGDTLARVMRAVQQAQKPSFQPLDALATAVALHSPQAAQSLTQFSFTWRIDPARSVALGGQTAQLLRVPQVGARYSMCLHVAQLDDEIGCSIEAVDSAHRGGQVAALWQAFERSLALLCAEAGSGAVHETARVATHVPAAADPQDAVLRAVWSRWLKVAPSGVYADSHFLRSGGSSLTAMRIAAELRREHGIRLDVSAFLADPTFARFASLGRTAAPAPPDGYVLVGPADFSRVMLLLPGAGGHAAGLYALADELQRRLPTGTSVAIVDLDAALHAAPLDDPLWFVSRRIVQIVRDLGQPRVMGMVGFSLGGTLALQAVKDLSAGPAIPVWMLDTFSPRMMKLGFWRKVERKIAWLLFGGRPGAAELSASSVSSSSDAVPLQASAGQWDLLLEQLKNSRFAAPRSTVRLIQARKSVKDIGLLWQRRNNGFVPRHYASWQVHEIDGAHLDLPRHLAASTAKIIVDHGQFDARSSS